MLEGNEYRWSFPFGMAHYANKNTGKFIPDKDSREKILLELPKLENLDQVKKLDDFFVDLSISVDINFETIQDEVTYIMSPLSKLRVVIKNVKTVNEDNAPAV